MEPPTNPWRFRSLLRVMLLIEWCELRRELDKAGRRLERELYPDRWHQASGRERQLYEQALKRVNAAFDTLERQVT